MSLNRPFRPRRGQNQASGPQPLPDLLRRAMSHLGGGIEPTALAALFSGWDQIAGSPMADHVRPVRMDIRTLVVTVDHPAWATKARASGAQLLTRVGETTGHRPGRLDVLVRRPERAAARPLSGRMWCPHRREDPARAGILGMGN